ncbi:NDxxF motif lipoprotein [Staphylococcus hominis]|uniref:NDxxF motif lipoprotein n=2 Tax=Staphylococcus hominis TaxID=1290 RepID=UPI000E69C615|nr:NDxxF motif lipoprotein [Staphylococcus hominis]MCE4951133.1 NDxxF motif lipoprotein [Staphylococcus hominis]MCE4953229.1 NDxxF motif lipoprotein [Staphylococcus hominis]MCE4976503.1 NDxxF motif lipoprotein [Staphylococcus hominis]RIO50843.1 NDxxF motif lipoprotein [Staphylococcus hominis]
MNIKKFFVLIMASFLFFSLTACGNSTEKSKNQTSNKNELPTIPKQVFSSNKINENISKKEIKKNVSKYLDTYHALIENIESLRNKDNLNKNELKKLNSLTEMNDKNDSNFSDFIQNNNLPNGYKDGVFKTKDYITTSNQYLNKLNTQIQKVNKNSNSDNLSTKDIDKINSINEQYKKDVNGKKQKEVETFLKDKNIKTKAFN